jgi:HEAT repeat protein
MSDVLREIQGWKGKPKALTEHLAAIVLADASSVESLFGALQAGNDKEKGVCLEVLEAVTRQRPELASGRIPFIIGFIGYKSPKARLESSRVVANVACRYPDGTAGAVPALLKNTDDEGTVVRWSAAFALGAILKHNERERRLLLPKIEAILKKEENNGVRNLYLKALKAIKP